MMRTPVQYQHYFICKVERRDDPIYAYPIYTLYTACYIHMQHYYTFTRTKKNTHRQFLKCEHGKPFFKPCKTNCTRRFVVFPSRIKRIQSTESSCNKCHSFIQHHHTPQAATTNFITRTHKSRSSLIENKTLPIIIAPRKSPFTFTQRTMAVCCSNRRVHIAPPGLWESVPVECTIWCVSLEETLRIIIHSSLSRGGTYHYDKDDAHQKQSNGGGGCLSVPPLSVDC